MSEIQAPAPTTKHRAPYRSCSRPRSALNKIMSPTLPNQMTIGCGRIGARVMVEDSSRLANYGRSCVSALVGAVLNELVGGVGIDFDAPKNGDPHSRDPIRVVVATASRGARCAGSGRATEACTRMTELQRRTVPGARAGRSPAGARAQEAPIPQTGRCGWSPPGLDLPAVAREPRRPCTDPRRGEPQQALEIGAIATATAVGG